MKQKAALGILKRLAARSDVFLENFAPGVAERMGLGAKELTEHPRIVALQRDPDVTREIEGRDYFALLRNERIVSAANDPELHALVRQFELEKALDYALNSRRN